jgi:hypothetical protein
MKNIFLALLIISTSSLFSQVGIETTAPDANAILDFPAGQNKGIILPLVNGVPTGAAATNGTFVIDRTDGIIKVRQNGAWLGLSKDTSLTSIPLNGSAETGGGVIIGATSSSAQGALVLESTNQGLMLPKVASPHLSIKSPHPGLICYDTDRNEIAMFNGSGWFYWR